MPGCGTCQPCAPDARVRSSAQMYCSLFGLVLYGLCWLPVLVLSAPSPSSIDGIIHFTLGHKYSSYRKKNPLAHSGNPRVTELGEHGDTKIGERCGGLPRGYGDAFGCKGGSVGGRLEGGLGECRFVATTRTSPGGSRPGRIGSTTVFLREAASATGV
jgi:hypothetical protein